MEHDRHIYAHHSTISAMLTDGTCVLFTFLSNCSVFVAIRLHFSAILYTIGNIGAAFVIAEFPHLYCRRFPPEATLLQ
jgi:hypothetical protein